MAIVLALIIGLASTLTVSSSAAAQSAERRWNYSPATGVLFNNPNGTKAGTSRIMRHLIKSINSAPRRSIIKMAVSFEKGTGPGYLKSSSSVSSCNSCCFLKK